VPGQCHANSLEKSPLKLAGEVGLPKAAGCAIFPAMESHEILREVFQKTSPKHIAGELGLSLSMVYKWAEPPEQRSGAANPLDRVAKLERCSRDERIVQWLCQQAGGFFIKNPKTGRPHPAFLVPAMNNVVQEFADLLGVMADSAHDNQVSPDEAKSIRARWETLKSVAEEFVKGCEEGDFRTLKHTGAAKK